MARDEWKSVYRQLLAAGLCAVDLERFNALTLNERSWPVLKGETPVRLRKDPALPKRDKKKKRRAPALAEDILTNWEAEALFDRLRDLRLSMAEAQSVPPYAIFADKTLLEFVRYRPRDMEEFACMSGVGASKLERFGQAFLESLGAHEEEHGRPDNIPEIPQEVREAKKREADAKPDFTATARSSLDLFLELGDVDAVAEARGLKPSSIWRHLILAVNMGKIDYRRAANLPDDERKKIEAALRDFRSKGVTAMAPVFEALGGTHPYDLIRLVAAGLNRA
jgi:ATP-dependent DNA helicase RecQ